MTGNNSNGKERQNMADNEFTRVIDDLRNPLASVWSLSEILHDFPDMNREKQRKFLEIINQETKRMAGILNRAELPVQSMQKAVTQT